MPNPVVHWEFAAKDGQRIQDFYAKLFDWNVDANNPMNYGFVDTKMGEGINGGIPQTDGPNRVTIYAQVDDLEAYLKKVESLGGKTVLPPTEIPDVVTFAHFSDPEGNIIGMVKG